MNQEPKCLRCQTSMEEGFIMDKVQGGYRAAASWVAGKPEPSFWTGVKYIGKPKAAIVTYRCPRCGYLESYAPEITG